MRRIVFPLVSLICTNLRLSFGIHSLFLQSFLYPSKTIFLPSRSTKAYKLKTHSHLQLLALSHYEYFCLRKYSDFSEKQVFPDSDTLVKLWMPYSVNPH